MAVSDYTTDYVTTMDRLEESILNKTDVEKLTGTKISSYEDNQLSNFYPTYLNYSKIVLFKEDASAFKIRGRSDAMFRSGLRCRRTMGRLSSFPQSWLSAR